MAEPKDESQKNGIWRIMKYLLPILVLFSGFFGVQIWMILDEQSTEKTEQAVSLNTGENSAKAVVAKLAASTDTHTENTPIPLPAPAKNDEQAVTSKIPGMEYYRLQVGNFDESGGAKKLKSKLQEMGYGSAIIDREGSSKVIVMTFFSRDQADMIKERLEGAKISVYPEKITVQDSMLMFGKDSRRLQDFMDSSMPEIQAMLRELCDHYYLYESRGMNTKEHEALVVSQMSRLSDMKTAIENMQVSKEEQALQTLIKEYLAGYIGYLERIRSVKKLERSLLWPGAIERIEAFVSMTVQSKVN